MFYYVCLLLFSVAVIFLRIVHATAVGSSGITRKIFWRVFHDCAVVHDVLFQHKHNDCMRPSFDLRSRWTNRGREGKKQAKKYIYCTVPGSACWNMLGYESDPVLEKCDVNVDGGIRKPTSFAGMLYRRLRYRAVLDLERITCIIERRGSMRLGFESQWFNFREFRIRYVIILYRM
jgi:hypothetical protein